MPNFEYTFTDTNSVRDATFEARLEAIGTVEAGVIAGLVPLTDVGDDGDYDVTTEAAYLSLLDEARGFWKKVK